MALLFLAVTVGVVYLELRWLIHRAVHWRKKPPPPLWPGRLAKHTRRLDLALNGAFLLGMICILYGRFIEPGWVEVRHLEIRSEKIAPESGRVRIAHLTDFHFDETALNAEKTVELVNAEEPDIVVFTGDFFNEEAGFRVVEGVFGRLKAPLGVCVVKGNYDYNQRGLDPVLKRLPAVWLRKGYRDVIVRGTRLRLVGLDPDEEPYFDRLMESLPGEAAYTVLLYHYAHLVYEASERGVDLQLSGHTHGGQVRLPLYGALVTLARFGKRFESGLYKVGGTTLYVSRGLGVEGGTAPRVRFLCRPEIVIIDLLPAEI